MMFGQAMVNYQDKSDFIRQSIKDSINAKKYLEEKIDLLQKAAETIYNAFEKGNKLLIFGNGGSAADAQHIAAEFVGRFKNERRGLAAIALTTDTSFLTAWGNDYPDGFETMFARQVETLAKPKDILWALSTSGNSENVLKAFRKGKDIGTYNISFTGKSGGQLIGLSDLNIHIPLNISARVQEAHETAYHIICELVDDYSVNKKG